MHWAEQAAKLSRWRARRHPAWPDRRNQQPALCPARHRGLRNDHAPSLVAQLIAALATDNRVLLGAPPPMW